MQADQEHTALGLHCSKPDKLSASAILEPFCPSVATLHTHTIHWQGQLVQVSPSEIHRGLSCPAAESRTVIRIQPCILTWQLHFVGSGSQRRCRTPQYQDGQWRQHAGSMQTCKSKRFIVQREEVSLHRGCGMDLEAAATLAAIFEPLAARLYCDGGVHVSQAGIALQIHPRRTSHSNSSSPINIMQGQPCTVA